MSSETYFNEVAGRWDDLQASFFSEAVRDQAIAAADVQPGRLAADIGAGTGFITQGLIIRGVQVIAVDQSPGMLAELHKKLRTTNLVEARLGSGDAIPISDDTVDYVFANMYLHHVEDPPHAIAEMVRILKSGGVLVLTDLDQHDVEFLRTEHHDRWLGFSRREVERWLVDAGLERVTVRATQESCSSTSALGSASAAIGIFLASGERPVAESQP